jgi:hypothetical protein
MVATSIFFIGIIAAKARFASSPPAASASGQYRGHRPVSSSDDGYTVPSA